MPEQLTFDLPARPALGRDDFFVSPSNVLAIKLIDTWQNWENQKLLLIGPKGAGKTHLAGVWATEADAQIINGFDITPDNIAEHVQLNPRIALENADRIAGDAKREDALFHLHNLVLAEGGRLLVTASSPPRHWGLLLPDLLSRMQAAQIATLTAPDDALLSAILVKLFNDRQLAVSPSLISYLVPRMERSFEGASILVASLDAAALAQSRAITQPLAAKVLDNLSQGPA